MNKLFILVLISLFLVGVVFAANNQNRNVNQNWDGSITVTKTITRNCDVENDKVECLKNMYKEMEIEREGNQTRLRIKNVTVTINGEIETDNKNRTYFNFENKTREVKIMPDTASERAIERLRIKVCNESNNCTIELKQVGEDNQTRLRYIVRAMKQKRFLFWKWNKQVEAEVDAETGEVS